MAKCNEIISKMVVYDNVLINTNCFVHAIYRYVINSPYYNVAAKLCKSDQDNANHCGLIS